MERIVKVLDAHRRQLKAIRTQVELDRMPNKAALKDKARAILFQKRAEFFAEIASNPDLCCDQRYASKFVLPSNPPQIVQLTGIDLELATAVGVGPITICPPFVKRYAFQRRGWKYFGRPSINPVSDDDRAAMRLVIEGSDAFRDLRERVDDPYFDRNKESYLDMLQKEFLTYYQYELPDVDDNDFDDNITQAHITELKRRHASNVAIQRMNEIQLRNYVLHEPLLAQDLHREEVDISARSLLTLAPDDVNTRHLMGMRIASQWRRLAQDIPTTERFVEDPFTGSDGRLISHIPDLLLLVRRHVVDAPSGEDVLSIDGSELLSTLTSDERRLFGSAFEEDLGSLRAELEEGARIDAQRQDSLASFDAAVGDQYFFDASENSLHVFSERCGTESAAMLQEIEMRLNAVPIGQIPHCKAGKWRKAHLSDAVHAYATLTHGKRLGAGADFQAAVIKLREYNPSLGEHEVLEILQLTERYMHVVNEQRQAKRLIDLIAEMKKSLVVLREIGTQDQAYELQLHVCHEQWLQLVDLIYDTVEPIKEDQRPYALVFTYLTGMWARAEQLEVIQRLCMAILRGENPYVLQQALMGFGKTKFVLPYLLFLMAHKQYIPLAVVYESQLDVTQQYLGIVMSRNLHSKLIPIKCTLDDFENVEKLKWLDRQLRRPLAGEPVSFIISSQTTEAFRVAYDLISARAPNFTEQDWRMLQVMGQIFRNLRRKGVGFLDEVDCTLNPFESFITPQRSAMEVKLCLPSAQTDLIAGVFQEMLADDQFGRFVSSNTLPELTLNQKNEFRRKLVLRGLDANSHIYVGDVGEHRDAFIRYCLGQLDEDGELFTIIDDQPGYLLKENIPDERREGVEQTAKWMLFLRQLEQTGGEDAKRQLERICLLRGLCTIYLTFSESVNLDYGYGPDGSIRPFNGPNEPSSNFLKDPFKSTVALCHCIATSAQLGGGIPRSAVSNCARLFYDLALHSEGGLMRSPLALRFNENLKRMAQLAGSDSPSPLRLEDLDPDSSNFEHSLDRLATLLGAHPENLWSFAREWMSQAISYDHYTYEGKSTAIPGLFKAGAAFSGTTSNYKAFSTEFCSGDVHNSKGSLGRIVNKFRRDISAGRSTVRFVDAADVTSLFDNGQGYQGVIDCGAFFKHTKAGQVAREILEKTGNDGTGVVYFDPDMRKFFWLQHAESQPMELSGTSLLELQKSGVVNPQAIRAYFDQPRTTGTDFKFPPQAYFTLTIDPATTTLDRFLQASMRARQFLSTQRIDIVILRSAAAGLLGEEPSGDLSKEQVALANFERMLFTLQKNQSQYIVEQRIQATGDKLDNLIHSVCLDLRTEILEQTEDPDKATRAKKIFQDLCVRLELRQISTYDPVAMFGHLRQWENAGKRMSAAWKVNLNNLRQILTPPLSGELQEVLGDRWDSHFRPLLFDSDERGPALLQQKAERIISEIAGFEKKSSSSSKDFGSTDAQVTVEQQQQVQQQQQMEMQMQLQAEVGRTFYRGLDGQGVREEKSWILGAREASGNDEPIAFADFIALPALKDQPDIMSLPAYFEMAENEYDWARKQEVTCGITIPGSSGEISVAADVDYRRFGYCFTEDLQVTTNFLHSCQQPLPVFHGTQKEMLYLLFYTDAGGKKRALAVSFQEAQDLQKLIEKGKLKDCWLISRLGESVCGDSAPFPQDWQPFRDRAIWQAHLFDGAVGSKYFTTAKARQVGLTIAQEFVAARDGKVKKEDFQKLCRDFLLLRYDDRDHIDPSKPRPVVAPKAFAIVSLLDVFSTPLVTEEEESAHRLHFTAERPASASDDFSPDHSPLPEDAAAHDDHARVDDLSTDDSSTDDDLEDASRVNAAGVSHIGPPDDQEEEDTSRTNAVGDLRIDPLPPTGPDDHEEEVTDTREIAAAKTWDSFQKAALILGIIAVLAIAVGIILALSVPSPAGFVLVALISAWVIAGVSVVSTLILLVRIARPADA
jgi:hypothetical protein